MRDSVNRLFQQRFQGHEVPVEASVWEGIQQQVATTTPAADGVNELFKDRFQGHEAPVDPAVWANISSQLGHTIATGTGAGAVWGWAAAGVVAVTTGAALLFGLLPPGKEATPSVITTETTSEIPASPIVSATPSEEEGKIALQEAAVDPPRMRTSIARPTASAGRSTGSEQATPPLVEVVPNTPGITTQPSSTVEAPGAALVENIIQDLTHDVVQEVTNVSPMPPPTEPVPSSNKAASSTTDEPIVEPAIETPVEPSMPKLFMPNTFTPNGDRINDTYEVEAGRFAQVLIRIYSLKTNALVFSTNTAEAWTGDGCEDGMYMVAVEAHTLDGRTTTEGKVVWLNRNPLN